MIYVPEFSNENCVYIYNSDIIRVYETRPSYNTTVNYKDYYIKSGYMYNTGFTSFGSYSNLPTCISQDRITTDIYYRNDLPQILIIFVIMSFICFWVPWKILCRLFRRFN